MSVAVSAEVLSSIDLTAFPKYTFIRLLKPLSKVSAAKKEDRAVFACLTNGYTNGLLFKVSAESIRAYGSPNNLVLDYVVNNFSAVCF